MNWKQVILEQAIKQTEFSSYALKTALNVIFSETRLRHGAHSLLKPYGISVQQHNILRILRGQKGRSLSIQDISGRMVDQMSNTSRLVDKLLLKNLVERKVCPSDRRRVEIYITEKGLDLMNETAINLDNVLAEKLSVLSESEMIQLNHLLDKINQ